MDTYIEGTVFEKKSFSETPLTPGEYEQCKFLNCDFSNSDLSNIRFTDCQFTGCNLSMAILAKTVFRDTLFRECKMMGLHFEKCNEYGLSFRFEQCNLNHCSFFKTKIKKTRFNRCTLHEADFSGSELIQSSFDQCDLANATFDNTNLEKADLRTAYNYRIDPETNKIKKARFSVSGLAGLLLKYDIDIDPNA